MSKKIALATLGAILSAAFGMDALANKDHAKQIPNMEKCYGVAKAGRNDCGTATAQCAGSSTADGDKNAWLLLPKGTCNKIIGGSTTEGKA
jgi:uncharacterized membrane protein